MGKIGNWLKGLIGLLVVASFAAALAWLLRSAMQPAGQVAEEPTSPIVTTSQPTWTPPTEQELRLTVVTPDAPPEVTATQAVATPSPTPTFTPQPPTPTPGPPTAMATPLPAWPSPIASPPTRPEKATGPTRLLFWRNVEPWGFFVIVVPEKGEPGVEEKLRIPQDYIKVSIDVDMMRASPSGDQLVYVVGGYEPGDLDGGEIWTARLDGSEARQLVTPTEQFYPTEPIWSPDGLQIAYTMLPHPLHAEPGANPQLWTMNADGSGQRMVTQDPAFSPILYGGSKVPFYWADDGHIYFINYQDDRLYAINPNSGWMFPLIEGVPLFDLVLAPDGQKAAATIPEMADKIERAGIPLVFTGGGDLLWSLDSRQIAFTVYEPEKGAEARTPGLWIRNVQTGKERLLLASEPLPQMFVYPDAWSPDSRMLAYSTLAGIWVANLETGESRLIVPAPRPEGGGVGVIAWGW